MGMSENVIIPKRTSAGLSTTFAKFDSDREMRIKRLESARVKSVKRNKLFMIDSEKAASEIVERLERVGNE